MVEQGLAMLVQAGVISTIPTCPGGYFAQLPKDLIGVNPKQVISAWTYRSIISEPTYFLDGQDGLTNWLVRIDAHGYTATNAIALARAIDGVLRGLVSVTLPDPDATVVAAIIRHPAFVDGFSDQNRSFVRSIEYELVYEQI